MIKDDNSWGRYFDKFNTSGLSASQFCRDEDLIYHRFIKRLRKTRSDKKSDNKNEKSLPVQAKFYKLELSGVEGLSSPVGRIQFPNGLCLELDNLPDPSWLSKLGGLRP